MRCPWKDLRGLLFPAVPLGGNVGVEKPGLDPEAVGPSSAQPKAVGSPVPPRFAVKHLSSSDCHFMSPGLLCVTHHTECGQLGCLFLLSNRKVIWLHEDFGNILLLFCIKP